MGLHDERSDCVTEGLVQLRKETFLS